MQLRSARGGVLEDESVATSEQLKSVKLVYDLIYNPAETRLVREAKKAGAETLGGFDMLIAQAIEQQKIWTGDAAECQRNGRCGPQETR